MVGILFIFLFYFVYSILQDIFICFIVKIYVKKLVTSDKRF
jgi:hypothetical protein